MEFDVTTIKKFSPIQFQKNHSIVQIDFQTDTLSFPFPLHISDLEYRALIDCVTNIPGLKAKK